MPARTAASSIRRLSRVTQPLTAPRNSTVPTSAKLDGADPRCTGAKFDRGVRPARAGPRVSGVSGARLRPVGHVGRVCRACRACRACLLGVSPAAGAKTSGDGRCRASVGDARPTCWSSRDAVRAGSAPLAVGNAEAFGHVDEVAEAVGGRQTNMAPRDATAPPRRSVSPVARRKRRVGSWRRAARPGGTAATIIDRHGDPRR